MFGAIQFPTRNPRFGGRWPLFGGIRRRILRVGSVFGLSRARTARGTGALRPWHAIRPAAIPSPLAVRAPTVGSVSDAGIGKSIRRRAIAHDQQVPIPRRPNEVWYLRWVPHSDNHGGGKCVSRPLAGRSIAASPSFLHRLMHSVREAQLRVLARAGDRRVIVPGRRTGARGGRVRPVAGGVCASRSGGGGGGLRARRGAIRRLRARRLPRARPGCNRGFVSPPGAEIARSGGAFPCCLAHQLNRPNGRSGSARICNVKLRARRSTCYHGDEAVIRRLCEPFGFRIRAVEWIRSAHDASDVRTLIREALLKRQEGRTRVRVFDGLALNNETALRPARVRPVAC